jgi:hypothetical protein
MPDRALREFAAALAAGGTPPVTAELARATLREGATRRAAAVHFVAGLGRYLWAGDTALHLAAAAYRADLVRALVSAGAEIRARNRLGDEPLHAAVVGQPGAPTWNPAAQVETIAALLAAGADPNALNKTGVAPLHRAVRTRCAAAVEALLAGGADPMLRNKNGSTAADLARHTTGRGGSGSPEARLQQQQILRLLLFYNGADAASGDPAGPPIS